MRKAFILLLSFVLFAASCNSPGVEAPLKDDADDFVGVYKIGVVADYLIVPLIGRYSAEGELRIDKISANRVSLSDFIESEAEVQGNAIYIEPTSETTSLYSITEVYNQGLLSGNVLTFSSVDTGTYTQNRKKYPVSLTARFTAIKQTQPK